MSGEPVVPPPATSTADLDDMQRDPKAFRQALGCFATGVTIVTTRGPDGRDVGLTANSFNSVSLDPPLVLWSLNNNSSSLPAFVDGGAFAVHVLAASQQSLSDRFASRSPDRFSGLAVDRGIDDTPLLKGCAALFQCRLAFRYDGGDHQILVGEVIHFEHTDDAPLIYHGGAYGGVHPRPSDEEGNQELGPGELLRLVSRAYHHLNAKAREEFSRRGLSQEDFWVLRMLGEREPQGAETMAAMIARGGRALTQDMLAQLEARGFIAADGPLCRLTEAGRSTMVELAAVHLASEEEALRAFDRSEVATLKRLLRRLFK